MLSLFNHHSKKVENFNLDCQNVFVSTFLVSEALPDPVVSDEGVLTSPPPPPHRRLTIVTDEAADRQVTYTLKQSHVAKTHSTDLYLGLHLVTASTNIFLLLPTACCGCLPVQQDSCTSTPAHQACCPSLNVTDMLHGASDR